MCLAPIYVKNYPYPVPCGKCLDCKMDKSNEWAFRIVNEASCYNENCFITLTYSDENKPLDSCVSVREMQLFLKRFRKHLKNQRLRYFLCGEYGEQFGRPHYHCIFFGYRPKDLVFHHYDKKGNAIYTSNEVRKIWGKGLIGVADLSLHSAKYCAKYLQKQPPEGMQKPFLLMSRKPAIGVPSLTAGNLVYDKIYADGHCRKLPRAYVNYLEKHLDLSAFKRERLNRAFGKFVDKSDYEYNKRYIYCSLDKYGKVHNIGRFCPEIYEKYVFKRLQKFSIIFSKIVS